MTQGVDGPPSTGPRADFVALLKLAVPLGLVQLGYQFVSLVDAAFAGRLSEQALAASGLGSSVFFAISVMGIGIALGIDPLVAQALGAREIRRARHVLWQGVYAAAISTVPLTLLVIAGVYQLERFGVVPELAVDTRTYVFARLPSLFPLLLAVTLRSYLQAERLTKPILWATVWTNVFNAAANYVLIFGDAGLTDLGLPAVGLPSFGLAGLGWATVVAMSAQAGALARAVWALPEIADGEGLRTFDPKVVREIFVIGTPIALHLVAEVGVFAAVQVLMGRMGVLATAAHQVALMFAAMTFSFALGVGSATSVQVGRAIGAGDHQATRRSGLMGVGLGTSVMVLGAVTMWTAPELLARILTPDPEVIALAATLLRIAGAFQIVDGVQTVAGGALRGAGVTRYTFIAHLIAHWVVGLPLGIYLARTQELGAAGLWWGLTAGLTVAAVVLAEKFLRLSRKPIARLG